ESSVEAAPQRSRRMRLALERGQATRRDLSLLLTLLYVVENSPSQALEEVDHAEQQGLSQHDAAHLRLGIHRSLSGRAFPRATTQPPLSDDQNTARQLAPKDIARQAELSVLAAPPEGLTLGSQQVWLLSALRLRIGMDPSASRHGREESDRAPGDASPAGPHSDSS